MTQVLTQGALDRALAYAASRIEALRRSITEYRQYRNTLAELSALTDRDLNDLGISRYDIASIARESVYGA